MGTSLGEIRTEQSWGSRSRAARVRRKSEEQWGKGTAGSWHVAARWVGAPGWVQSHKLLLSGWPWCQLPQRGSCSEPPTPPLLWDGGIFWLLPGQLLEQREGSMGCEWGSKGGQREEKGLMRVMVKGQ